ncbi:hypothetical protein SAMN03080617_03300 [Algoriphagus alkaliphilus]|jgi:hypothetical protein|uniref:HPt domain-containing protein n=1 Tax=Algoriphagus alkaliphilus TaxID=279824 RepID=A0A1G5Z6V3_9BACT|nr:MULTISPECIES: hypothetical protein [Algoriphagus]MBA4298782.1 hypothetical protein [Cyclobacterium sp.]MDO8965811.1 hypothetical protein [Algoriphagus sp.]MDP2042514.1 hypothetical protein [Algoriphagus sp.]MDP3198906.1 hypothetical protein [Algoriphagus sp.]MDP3471864.1 hypothetical protein [Algoriphagus sp.]
MNSYYPELNQRILEMAEGDEEFRMELTSAIYNGLIELQSKYAEGLKEKDEVIIQQIRHKIKPTLMMFEFSGLAEALNEGKVILESQGFGFQFEQHFQKFLHQVELAISEVDRLK